MNEDLDNDERREYARVLYVKQAYTIKETALTTNTDEATIRQWIAEGAWEDQKRAQLISKSTQIRNFYDQIGVLQSKISKDPDNINTKEVDLIVKYTAAIKNLGAEVDACQVMDVSELFIKWLRKKDLALARTIIPKMNAFIKSYLAA